MSMTTPSPVEIWMRSYTPPAGEPGPERENSAGQGAVLDSNNNLRINYSTATEAQRRRIVAMLRSGPCSTLDFRRAGIMQSQTRIFELRNRLGYDIPTVARITVADADGYIHVGVAVYELVGEPEMAQGGAQ